MKLTSLIGQPCLDESFPLPLDEPFTTKTAYGAGLSRWALHWLLREGFLRRPLKNVYVATQAPDTIDLRAQCLRLVVPADCVICDRHAGWLLGAEMVLRPNEHIHLEPISLFRPSDRGRLRNQLCDSGERNLIPSDITEVRGLPVTTPLRTAWDLGRVRYREQAIAGLDAMLRLGVFTREDLLAGIERFRRMRWVTTLRSIAPIADGRAESPGESVLRLRWIDCGLPTPELQIEVWRDGVLIARLDVGNEDLRFAAEYDGAEWHSSAEQREHD